MFAGIPYKAYQGETELEQGPIESLFDNSPSDYTFNEFRKNWEAMGLITGEAISYYLSRSTNDGIIHLQLAPSQHIEIIYGNFDNPIKGYTLDITSDTKKIIPPENIWHARFFPQLDFTEGKNYRGLSPIKVAAKKINSEVFGDEIVEATFKRGMPPGVLYREVDQFGGGANIEEQRKEMEATWDKKYGNRKKAGKPIFTNGKLGWIPIGFSNFTDLQLDKIQLIVLRTLCNMWGIPSRVMNDMESGSYTKDKEDRKAIYTNRLIPDNDLFWSGINKLLKSTGIHYEADYTSIPELQEDKSETAKIYKIGWDANSVQINEFREKLNLEPDPSQEGLYRSDVETNPMTQQTQPELPPEKL
jgi:HK97 family phage portal protein